MPPHWTRRCALACLLGIVCSLEGCISVRSFVAVEPLDLHEGYREYSDSLLSFGPLEPRDAPGAQSRSGSGRRRKHCRAAGGAWRKRTNRRRLPRVRALRTALRAAQALDRKDTAQARRYYLVAAREAARLLFPDGKMIHTDPFDQKYRLASSFYSLAAGRYFLLLMASGRTWTGDITEPLRPARSM